MKLKQRIGDFRVRELLVEGYLGERGDHAVYRVTKRKLTTAQAVEILATEAGVPAADVGLAGLKDRQAITIQHMSIAGGRPVRLRAEEVLIEPVGRAHEPVSSAVSLGNAFEIIARDLDRGAIQALRRSIPLAREQGVVNYFDEQRFGNVKHGQGWIARDLMLGDHEGALKALLTARSVQDDERRKRFKDQVAAHWGDWRECRDEAGRFGQHHSVFEHLAKQPDDFAGAFQRVALRLRLIHLYAYQSHVWNRAVSELIRRLVPLEGRLVLEGLEGNLVSFAGELPAALRARPTFRLPGDLLADVTDPLERELVEEELARQHMTPAQFRIEGVPGFQLKGEDRPLIVVPRHLRVRPAEEDPLHPRAKLVRVRFELPRGSYATLVMKRLLARPTEARADEGPRSEPRGGEERRRDTRGGQRRPGGAGGRPRSGERDSGFQGAPPRASERGGGYQGDRPRSSERSGGYQGDRSRSSERGGGYQGGRSGSSERSGGYQGGRSGSSERGGGYQGGRSGSSERSGGYQGGRSGSSERSGGYQGGRSGSSERGGGYQGGRSGSSERGGGYQGGRSGSSERSGGYQGGRSRSGERGGGYQGGRSGSSERGGGYQSGRPRSGERGARYHDGRPVSGEGREDKDGPRQDDGGRE